MRALDVIDAGPEHAEAVVDVIHRSFGARPTLDPPSTALDETVESVAEVLADAGGLLVERRGVPMGALLFDESRPGRLGLRRVSVDPDIQARGVASAMVGVAEDTAEERGKATKPRARKQAPPLLLFLLGELEMVVRDSDRPLYHRAFAWYRLFRHWASLRWDDTQALLPSSLERRARGVFGSWSAPRQAGQARL